MLAARAVTADADNPIAALSLDDISVPVPDSGWVRVQVKATALNHHDVWTLRGVGIDPSALPMTLGCEASGIDDTGRAVIVHGVIADPDAGGGDETLDPKRSLLSEVHQGTFAEYLVVPARNVLPKPAGLSFEEAACLPVAWLTAYRMLTTRGQLRAGETVLVQGAAGGVASAAIALGRAMGLRVWATGRTESKRAFAESIGAHAVFEPGDRLPHRVDAVIETVGEATWAHSMRSLRPGGRIIISGATSGPSPSADLSRLFFLQLQVIGSTMGTVGELAELISFVEATGIRPSIERVMPLTDAATAISAMAAGEVMGKTVLLL
ncbi:MAG TPA: Zn-dependent oxidoreductase [Actinobacteria bacterium]|nr:Zn-dependent oxidoreductase [Actinomycetota bacterium]